jgi:hypothetical protein
MSHTIKQWRGITTQERHWRGRTKDYKSGKRQELGKKYRKPDLKSRDGWEGF